MYKSHVLVVDDEQNICNLLSEYLNELGYSCEVALDGNYALQKIIKGEYDITLLDIKLPGISGIELLKEIKARSNSAVIMVTSVDDVNTAVESMKLGALDYIVKPFDLNILNSCMSTALEKNERSLMNIKKNVMNSVGPEEEELQKIDAIASGIEIKLDLTDKRSTIVTSRTIEVAREIGIPEEQITQWVTKRLKTNKENMKLLKKFSQNAIAQVKMGAAPEYLFNNNSFNSEN
jgi:DNA-binding response OmpR family regulator